MTDGPLSQAGFFNHRVIAADESAGLTVGVHHAIKKQPDRAFHAAVVLGGAIGHQPAPQRCPPAFLLFVRRSIPHHEDIPASRLARRVTCERTLSRSVAGRLGSLSISS